MRTCEEALSHTMIVEHQDGRIRHFGPIEDLEIAARTAEYYFGYEGTPHSVSFVPLKEPLGSEFLDCLRKDGER